MMQLFEWPRVALRVTDGVAHAELNRPEKRNALDRQAFEDIAALLAQLQILDNLRAVVVSGRGAAFSAGIDLSAFQQTVGVPAAVALRTHGDCNLFQHVATGWRDIPVPIIAAIQDIAFGAGFQLILGMDIRIVAPAARLSIREAHWGLVPDMAGFVHFRQFGQQDILRELTYTGRIFSGEQARGWGLATHVADDPLAKAMDIAQEIASGHGPAVRAAKRLFNLAASADAASILLAESQEQAVLMEQLGGRMAGIR